MHIKNFFISNIQYPLNQPFRTALGTHPQLENILVTLEFSDGTKGRGEAAIASHITGETIAQTKRNLEKVRNRLLGQDPRGYLKISCDLHESLTRNKAALAAVEMALMDALTRHWKMPLWRFFGKKAVLLRTDITIVIADLEETKQTVRKYFLQGFRSFKVKIGRDFELDIKRLLAIKYLAPRVKIYVDANQGYSVTEMLKFLKILKRQNLKIDLLEQPVPRADWEGLKEISRASDIPVCADESVRSLKEAVGAIEEKACQVINIKLMKFGLFEAREISMLAKVAGVKLMIGGMMETSLAMTAAAHLAAGLGGFQYIDLDTPFFIKKGSDRNPYLSSSGLYDLRSVKGGIGIMS